MNLHHTTLPLANLFLHRIHFAPETFQEADLLWLPHHHKLSHAGKKRKAEHLAGRIAAFHGLKSYGLQHIPDIGDSRQPLWPADLHGSITHCGTTAIAVISQQPVGIDLEEIFSAPVCEEIAAGIITSEERQRLTASGLPFPLALTLAFSAKESLYKALSGFTTGLPGFSSAEVVAIDAHHLILGVNPLFSPALAGKRYPVVWQQQANTVLTLLTETFQPA